LAEDRVALADVSWSWAAVGSAVARTVPAGTRSPTFTATFWTGQINDDPLCEVLEVPLVAPPLPDVVATEVTMSGVEPNLKPYTVLAATVPVATDWALTAPVETVDVRYFELDDAPRVGPTTANATAPTPTRISAIAASLVFIDQRLSWFLRVASTHSTHGESRFEMCVGYMGLEAETSLKRSQACTAWPVWPVDSDLGGR
jgi:hypothetical protein